MPSRIRPKTRQWATHKQHMECRMATNPQFTESTLSEHLESVNDRLEELAAAGEWAEVADLMRKRNAMLREVHDVDRSAVLLTARQTTDRLLKLAEAAKLDVGDKLTKLQRGKAATEVYREHA